jgi:hypothetical protein
MKKIESPFSKYDEIDFTVDQFASLMKYIMKDARNMRKPHWSKSRRAFLIEQLKNQVGYLIEASTPDKIRKEAADVANYAMMLWDRADQDSACECECHNDLDHTVGDHRCPYCGCLL